MNDDANHPNGNFGLLACGSSGRWTVDIDESPDGTEWSLQLDGPQVYLAVSLQSLGVLANVHEYLRSGRASDPELPFGHFGAARVSLNWDNEDVRRCFVIVSGVRDALRVTLSAEDTVMLAAALEQVLDDVPPEARTG